MDDRLRQRAGPVRGTRREAAIAAILVLCVALVAFWEVMANRSRNAFAPFALTAQSLAELPLTVPGWTLTRLPIAHDPIEPNILALLVRPARGGGAAVLVRLVHGYNMVDCMRIKGAGVELIADTRAELATELAAAGSEVRHPPSTPQRGQALGPQVWRVRLSPDHATISATAMLRAGDFSGTAVDTRAMPFPRVDIPDNPGWFPQGLTWRSLRHPIRNGRLFLRAKWNASRTDLLTFLGLRQPAWASEELLALVATTMEPTVPPEREDAVADQVLAAQACVHALLRAWAAERTPP